MEYLKSKETYLEDIYGNLKVNNEKNFNIQEQKIINNDDIEEYKVDLIECKHYSPYYSDSEDSNFIYDLVKSNEEYLVNKLENLRLVKKQDENSNNNLYQLDELLNFNNKNENDKIEVISKANNDAVEENSNNKIDFKSIFHQNKKDQFNRDGNFEVIVVNKIKKADNTIYQKRYKFNQIKETKPDEIGSKKEIRNNSKLNKRLLKINDKSLKKGNKLKSHKIKTKLSESEIDTKIQKVKKPKNKKKNVEKSSLNEEERKKSENNNIKTTLMHNHDTQISIGKNQNYANIDIDAYKAKTNQNYYLNSQHYDKISFYPNNYPVSNNISLNYVINDGLYSSYNHNPYIIKPLQNSFNIYPILNSSCLNQFYFYPNTPNIMK